jgi:hypothetical protein
LEGFAAAYDRAGRSWGLAMGFELINYTNILHRSGINSKAAADFRRALSEDPDFLRRADVIDRLFLLRDRLRGCRFRPGPGSQH